MHKMRKTIGHAVCIISLLGCVCTVQRNVAIALQSPADFIMRRLCVVRL